MLCVDAHAGEEAAALRHVGDAARARSRPADGRRAPRPASVIVPRRGRRDADDRLQQRRLAGAVAAEQRHDLVLVHVEGDVAQDVALAVEGVDARRARAAMRLARGAGARLLGERMGARADVDLLHARRVARVLDRAVDQHLRRRSSP